MKISIVIPCKNQSETCFSNIEKVGLPYFESLGVDFEFLVVLDGSDDKNVSLAEMLIEKFVTLKNQRICIFLFLIWKKIILML